jgi:hypothetical protein
MKQKHFEMWKRVPIIKFTKFKNNNKLKLKKKPGNNSVHLLPICYKNLVILSGNFCSSGTNLIGRKLKKKNSVEADH